MDNHEFKVGDLVQVVNDIDGHTLGWDDSYVAIGDMVEVRALEKYGDVAVARVTSDKLRKRRNSMPTWTIFTHSLSCPRGPW